MQAGYPQRPVSQASVGGVPAPDSALYQCKCGVTTPRPECYFCTRTRQLRRQRGHINRRLTADQEDAIRASKATVPQLASLYAVTTRTIYRVLARRPMAHGRVVFGDYHAEFELTEDGPRQRTSWRAVDNFGGQAG